MSQSEDRRSVILDRLADYVLAEGLEASSLRPLAKAAGTSDRMLLYYFQDKEELMAATLGRVAERLVGILEQKTSTKALPFDKAYAKFSKLVLDDALWPYMCLWLDVASRSARGDALYAATGDAIGRGFLAWGAGQLDCPNARVRKKESAQLLARLEGLIVLKALGLEDVARDAR